MAHSPDYVTTVYFIRHGIAAERGTYLDDNQRPLIEKGIRKTEKTAQRLLTLRLRFDMLLTSPLVRAVQTAEIFCQAGLTQNYQVFKPLAPNGSVQDWLDWLGAWQSVDPMSLALVGHEPDLSQWAQLLVQGSIDNRWVLKKAGIIGVTVPAARSALGHSQLFWLAPPRLML
ncbi:phosphohistidine [Leptolyngbya sp. Heron Island J]|uniref:phosphohistidine phosphatase SixA n=1 Tax=Leptolyngbya sp. Heron Island J TaxID=1385935 RepID=UPI0003B95DCD|nr:phosphohistidine phosphatase SixA [Leptolyngbya sp. Heron Island J]ESA33519.1 phosphohistidine [Leptolyngbya sp. Heron Island J]